MDKSTSACSSSSSLLISNVKSLHKSTVSLLFQLEPYIILKFSWRGGAMADSLAAGWISPGWHPAGWLVDSLVFFPRQLCLSYPFQACSQSFFYFLEVELSSEEIDFFFKKSRRVG